MSSPRATILAALLERLATLPATGLRDGELGEPEVTLSPLAWHDLHRAEIEAPRPGDLSADGADSLKAAVIPVVLHYSMADPLT